MVDKKRDDGLEAFFDAARQVPEPASEALMARVLDDALAVQAAQAGETHRARSGPRLFSVLFSGLGGWPAVAGLATAAVAGLWIGFSPALGVGEAMTSALDASGFGNTAYDGYSTGFDFAFEDGALEEGDAG